MSNVQGSDARTPRQLFSPYGTIGPLGYLAWGTSLLLLKIGIDAGLVAVLFEDASWSPWLYLTPLRWQNVYPLAAAWHWLLFGAVSLPFLWIGVCLTLRRLRDAGMPGWPLALFVLPPFNWLLFLLLALVIPSRERPPEQLEAPKAALLDNRRALHVVIANVLGFAILAATFSASVYLLSRYGLAVFIAGPFLHGFVVALWLVPRGVSTGGAVVAAIAGLFVAILLMAGARLEGMGCLAMTIPLVVPSVALGAVVGGAAIERTPSRRPPARRALLPLLLGPLTAVVEHALQGPAAEHSVTTSLEIAAAPEQVWPLVVEFPALAEPEEFLFRAGIAYPTSARIDGTGKGAVRHCTFNTGSFVEPITVWDPPRHLAFDVVDSPQPMIEWNPFYEHVDAPHLHGFFRANHGEFRLEEVPTTRDGVTVVHTRLSGTTWYQHGLQPEFYWQWWSDLMVHAIHRRVLAHIAGQAESRGNAGSGGKVPR